MFSYLVVLLHGLNAYVSSAEKYNYYELAVQKWCSDEYMIHGLWPQYNRTAYPEDCAEVSYIPPQGDLLNDMNAHWHECDNTLWEHEWEKHGSCMHVQIGINETEYYNTALSMFLENEYLLDNCIEEDCILGCFDLDYAVMPCPDS